MAENVKTVKVLIDTIDKVKNFVATASQFNADMDLVSGRYIIDAKSILGLFSLDLSKPVELRIESSDPAETEKVLEAIKSYIVQG